MCGVAAAMAGGGGSSGDGGGDDDDGRRPRDNRVPAPFVASSIDVSLVAVCNICGIVWPRAYMRPHPDTIHHPHELICAMHGLEQSLTLQASLAQQQAGCNAVPVPLLDPAAMQAIAANRRTGRSALVHRIVGYPGRSGTDHIKYHCGLKPGVIIPGRNTSVMKRRVGY